MGKARRQTRTPPASHQQLERRLADDLDTAARSKDPSEQNIRAVARLEETARTKRTPAQCVSDRVTALAGSPASIALHVVWFVGWLVLNARVLPLTPFDPFPFSLLTSVVSLEAIFLALFVLESQNRLAHEADNRARLDLQVNLLAEQEMTVVLRMLREVCEHLQLTRTISSPEFKAFLHRTDIDALADRVEQLTDPDKASPDPAAA